MTSFLSNTVSKIPKGLVLTAGSLAGSIAYLILIPYRKIVKRNLAFAYPHWNRSRIRYHAKAVFRNACITALETLQALFFDRDHVLKHVRIKGDQEAIDLISREQAILITGHVGNWEMNTMFVPCYFHRTMVVVARDVNPPVLNRLLLKMRSRFGNIIINKMNALPQIKKFMAEGHNIGLLVDQGTKVSEGVEVQFFQRRVTATPVVAILARRYRCPVIPGFCIREKDGGLSAIIYPPLPFKRTRDLRSDIIENTQMMVGAIEKVIRAYPDQWFWFNKRWKRFYPWLYPEYQERRRRKRAREERQEKRRQKKLARRSMKQGR